MSFTEEVDPYIPYIYSTAFKLCQDRTASEDITQETLIQAWKHWNELSEPLARKAWLRRICTNIFLMGKRKEKGYTPLSLDALTELDREGAPLQIADSRPLPEEEVIVAETILEIRNGCFLAMTRKLTLEQRMAFSLTDMFGVGIEETAEIIGVSISAAKALLHRARMNLDSFFASRCNLIKVENPCSCESYLNFHNQKQEMKEEVRNRINTFVFKDKAEGYSDDIAVRNKVRAVYANLPDRVPEPSWYENMINTLKNLK